RVVVPRHEVCEGVDVLRGQPLPHPLGEHLAAEEALFAQQVEPEARVTDALVPAAVLELPEVEREDDLAQLGGVVARRDQRRRDRTGGCAREILRAVATLLEQAERTCERDSLDAAALEDEVDRSTFCRCNAVRAHFAPPLSL